MKKISKKDQRDLNKLSNILLVLMGLLILTPAPLLYFLDKVGIVIWVVLVAVTMYVALIIEKKKKEFNIHT